MNVQRLSQWLLAALLLQHSGGVSGQFITASPTCPGDPFTFRCTVDGNGFTIWRVNIGGTFECPLSHIVTGSVRCGPNNEFTATPRTGFGPGTSATSFSSTLSGTATLALDGTLVECFGPAFSTDAENRVGNSTVTIRIIGPPSVPTLSCVGLSEDISGAVNVTVSWTLSSGNSADFYLISIASNAPQIPYGGLLNIMNASATQQELTGFQTGYGYDITIRGVNCRSQEGRESEPLRIALQVPGVPSNCTVAAIYSQSSGTLLSIHSSWDTVPELVNPVETCPGVAQYQISFQTGPILETENVSIAECTAGRCRHIFQPSPDPLICSIPSSYDSVSVAAENVAGVGAAGTCTAQPISTTNIFLTLAVVNVSFPVDAQLQCTFLSGFNSSDHCRVQYGTDPTFMSLPYSAESNETGVAGDSVIVVMREQLNSSTVYYYTVSAENGGSTVIVQGTFTTPQYNCSLSELQMAGEPEDSYSQCQQDQDIVTSITIPNGVINVTCYSGRQFMSVASHVCDEGYKPNATSSVRVCRDNGVWSGTTIVCDVTQTTCSTGGAVGIAVVVTAVVVTGTTTLTVGVLAGVLLYYCITKHRSKSTKISSHMQQQAVSSSEEVSAQAISQEEKIDQKENLAYGSVQEIELRANEAYVPVQH